MKALITGASSGIGEALAHLLHSKGYSLILSGRNEKRLRKLSEELNSEYVAADLCNQEEVHRLIKVVHEQKPELLVNCAGYGYYGEALDFPVEEHLAVLEVNAAVPIRLTLEAARALLTAKKEGVILNVSSVAGEKPTPGMGLYGPSKACLTQFSRALNTELISKGIHVLVSCPGMVATDFANRAAKKSVTLRGGPVMTAEFAAKQIWKQIESKQEMRIFNWFYILSTYLVPAFLVKKIIWKKILKRL